MFTASARRGQGTVFIAILLTTIVAAACGTDADGSTTTEGSQSAEDAAAGSPTTAAVTEETVPTTAGETVTTSSEAPTTATTVPAGDALNYLRQLLATEQDIADLFAEARDINDRWDNRTGGVTLAATEEALSDAAERAQELIAVFDLIDPPPGGGIPDHHETAAAAVRAIADTVLEMIAGLRSSDTGERRQAALLRFSAVLGIYSRALERVAEAIGDEGTAALGGNVDGPTTTTEAEDTTTTTEAEDTTTTTEAEDTTTTTEAESTTTTTEAESTTTTTEAETTPSVGAQAQWWRPGLAEEALALVTPGSVGADNWDLVEEGRDYGTRAFYRFHFFQAPLAGGTLTQEHRQELSAFGDALASARAILEQSPLIYYPYRYDIRWVEHPSEVAVSAVYPTGETRQVVARQNGAIWNVDPSVDIPTGPPIRPTTPFSAPRWPDTAGVLGQSCPPVEDIWTRGSPVTDSCTLAAIDTAMDYLWSESSELRRRAVRDGHVLTDLLNRLDNQDNAYLAALYGQEGRKGVTTAVRNVRWAGNWAGASMIHLEYQNTHADRPLTTAERDDAITYFRGLRDQGVAVDDRFVSGDFTLGFSWPWQSTLMVRTADGTWRMSYRSFCQFHGTLNVVDQPRFSCPGDPTPHFPDSDFYDRDLWPPNHVLYYSDPRQENSPRFNDRYLGTPPS